jgi:transposase
MIIFPDLPPIEVEGVEVAEEITLTLRTISSSASCPSCGTASSHIQSRYTRTLRDLPAVGHPIRLIMHVRRFFCTKSCAGYLDHPFSKNAKHQENSQAR